MYRRRISIKDVLLLLLQSFLSFIKKLLTFVYFNCISGFPIVALLITVPMLLKSWGMDADLCYLLVRIIATIAPVIPTALFAVLESEDVNNEFSTDLWFVLWILIILWAWFIY